MRSTSLYAVAGAVLATALLSQGCRTLNRSRDRVTADDIPFETVNQPSRISRSAPERVKPVEEAPVAEERVVPAPVAEAPVRKRGGAVAPVALEKVTAQRPEMDTTPYEAQVVKSVDQVGKPDSYIDFVVPEGGGDKAYAIESDGLMGSTGRHTSLPAPKPEPVPVVKQAPAGSGLYVVQPGDILGRIAQKHGVSRQAILDANPSIKDANKLVVGQKIKIPPRGTGITDKPKTVKKSAAPAAAKQKKTLPAKEGYTVYTVKKGDILGRIAIAHKTTVKALMEANGITDPKKLREGQPIYVPAAGAAAPAAAPAPAVKATKAKSSAKAGADTAPKPAEKPADAGAPEKSPEQILSEFGL